MKKIIVLFAAVCIIAGLCGCDALRLMTGSPSPVETRDAAVIEKEGPNADDVLAELHLLARDVYMKREAYFAAHGSTYPKATEKELNGVRFVKISTPFSDCNNPYTDERFKEYAPYFMESSMMYNDTPVWDERQKIYDPKDVVCLSARISYYTSLKPSYITFNFDLPYDMASEFLILFGSTTWTLTQEDIDFENRSLFGFSGSIFEGMTGFTSLDIDEDLIRSLSADKIKYLYDFVPTLRYYIFDAGADDYEGFDGEESCGITVKEYNAD